MFPAYIMAILNLLALASLSCLVDGFSVSQATRLSSRTVRELGAASTKNAAKVAEGPRGGVHGACLPPSPSLQALAGPVPLRACVVCPPGAERRASAVLPAEFRGPMYKLVLRNSAREASRVMYLSTQGVEEPKGWLQPGERTAFYTLPGSWWRVYGVSGTLLLEHQVGLVPVMMGASNRQVSGPGGCTNEEAWRKPITRPIHNVTCDEITTGFLNLAGAGVDLMWVNRFGQEELVVQLVAGQASHQHVYNHHEFVFRDEAGQELHRETIKDVEIPDCGSRASRVAAAMPLGMAGMAAALSEPASRVSFASMSI